MKFRRQSQPSHKHSTQSSRFTRRSRRSQQSSLSRDLQLRIETLEVRTLLSVSTSDPYQAAVQNFDGSNMQKDGPTAKVGFDLSLLDAEYQVNESSSSGNSDTGAVAFAGNSSVTVFPGNEVAVDASPSGSLSALESDMQGLGMQITGVADNDISALLPISQIEAFAQLSTLESATPVEAGTAIGSVTSQADTAQLSNQVRRFLGFDGTGQTVGILSDSYNNLGGAATDVTNGDLPGTGNPNGFTTPVNVLQDLPSGGTDEGRAMLQIVHDVAPGANLDFATASLGQAQFANNIAALRTAGATVIADDVFYFAEPYFQDGVISQAVDASVAAGVPYFALAGNSGNNSYEAAFNPDPGGALAAGAGTYVSDGAAPAFQGGTPHDFGTGQIYQNITVANNGLVHLGFQWNQPYHSVNAANSATTDLDIYLLDATTNHIVAGSINNNVGGDPTEVLNFRNTTGSSHNYNILIVNRNGGPNPTDMKWIAIQDSNFTVNTFATNSSTSWGHENSATGFTVGAANFNKTPAFGTNPAVKDSYSSVGGMPVYFDTAGNLLATPSVRQHPDVIAPDGAATAVTGTTEFALFSGTSAATPAAAAVGALMLQAHPSDTPVQIYSAMRTSAAPMQTPVPNFNTGYGLLQAPGAVFALGGTYTVTVDAGAQANDGTADTFKVVVDGTNYDYYVNGSVAFSSPIASTAQINVNGSSDDDTLTIDNSGGLISTPINFSGGAGTNTLIVTGNAGAGVSAVYSDTGTDATGFSGSVTSTQGATTETIDFSGLSPVEFLTPTSSLTINMAAGANVENIVTGPTSTGIDPILGTTATTYQVNYGGGEPINWRNATTVIVNGSTSADTITENLPTREDAGSPNQLTTLNIDGNGTTGGGFTDAIDVLATPSGVTTNADDKATNLNYRVVVGSTTTTFNNGTGTLANVNGAVNATDSALVGGGTAVLLVDDSGGTGPDTATVTSTAITVGSHPAIGYDSTINEAVELALTAQADTFNVQSTNAGAGTTILFGNNGDDTFNVSSSAGTATPTNVNGTLTGNLSGIQGRLDIRGDAGTNTLNVSDYSGPAGQTYTVSTVVATITQIAATASAGILYNDGDPLDIANLNLTGSSAGGNTYDIDSTTATKETTVQDGDASAGAGGSTFNITGDNLSAANTFQGHGGKESFFLNVTTSGDSLGTNAVSGAPLTGVTINGGAGGGDTTRNQLIINDKGNLPRFLNFAYQDSTSGDLNIAPQPGSNGLGGNSTLSVVATGVQTVIANNSTNNNYTTISGVSGQINQLTVAELPTAAGDNANLLPNGTVAGHSVTAFLGGTPYLSSPPVTIANSRPGVAGGSKGPDLLINGIPEPLTLHGGGAATNDQAIVYAASENNLVDTGNAADIFGLGAGVLQAGFGAGNAYDLVSVNGATTPTFPPKPFGAAPDTVAIDNSTGGASDNPYATSLVSVFIDRTTGFQPTSMSAAAAPNVIVDGGDEAGTNPNTPGIADDFVVAPSSNYNIQVNGNLPGLNTVNGVPQGDQLNLSFPGSINVYSDNASPPNVTVTGQTSTGGNPFGVKYSSIERTNLTPGNGIVNIAGDNDVAGGNQNDYFKIRGGIDPFLSPVPLNGMNQFSLQIGGSWDPASGNVGTPAPAGGLSGKVWFSGVTRINASGGAIKSFDANGSAIPDDTDASGTNALDITPYADNTPTGWGIATYWDQGKTTPDGGQPNSDLLVFNGVTGVSDNIVVLPSAPLAGQVVDTMGGGVGTPIAIVNYTNNSNIIVNGSSPPGTPGDTDTLTIDGTDPDSGTTSGNDSFTANFAAPGTAALPNVTVDDSVSGKNLYNLQNLTNINTLNVSMGDGDDTFDLVNAGSTLNYNIDGGSGSNALDAQGSGTFSVYPGASSDSGSLSTPTNNGNSLANVNFTGIQAINLTGTGTHDNLQVFGTGGSDVFTQEETGVTVNGGPAIGFNPFNYPANPNTGFTNIDLMGGGGQDHYDLNPSAVGPDPLAIGTSGATLNVVSDALASGSTMSISAAGGPDALTVVPTAAGNGDVTDNLITGGAQLGFVTYSGIAGIDLVGTSGSDTAGVAGTTGNDSLAYTPGTAGGSGTITGTLDAGAFALPTVSFSQMSPTGPVDLFATPTLSPLPAAAPTLTGGTDTATIDGTAKNDTFAVDQGTGAVTLNGVAISTGGATNLTLNGEAGDNTYTITGSAAPLFSTITVNGSGLTDPDVLNLIGDGSAITVNLNGSTSSLSGGGLGTVDLSGVDTVNVNAGGGQITVTGTTGADTLAATPTGAGAVSFQAYSGGTAQNGQGGTLASLTPTGPAYNATNVSAAAGGFTVNGNGGGDMLFVEGTQNADTTDVNDAASGANAVKVNALLTVNYNAALSHVEFDGLAGSDTINIAPSTTTSFLVDGGDPIGVVPGDTINLLHPPGSYQIFPGPTKDSGGLVTAGFQTVSWAHIETVINTGGGAPIITGTNGNDEITVIARDSSYNPSNPGVPNPLLDGVQDFTVSVNDGPDMLFVNTPNLFIDALSGNDDIVVQEPAPNNAAWNVQVFVAAGAPASGANRLGDNIELETPGTQSVTYNPNNPLSAVPPVPGAVFSTPSAGGGQFHDTTDTSTITATQFLFPGLYQSSSGGAENFIYAGDSGNDSLSYNTPAGLPSNLTFTPGATADSGTITGSPLGGAALTPLTFSDLGGGGKLSFTSSNAGRFDSLAVNGTAANDTFVIDAGTGTVHLNTQIPLLTPGVGFLNLNGLAGDNIYSISATAASPQPYQLINVLGSGVTDPDVLNLIGDGTAVTADLGGPVASVTGGGLALIGVNIVGVGLVNLDDGVGAVTVSGTANPDTFNVTPTDTNSALVQANGVAPQLDVTAAGSLTFGDTNPPDGDQVVVNGTSGNDTIAVARGAATTVSVNALLPVNVTTADATSLTVATGLGTDAVTVSGAGGPALTVNGGQSPASDSLTVNNTAASGNTTVTPGATNDSGTVANTDGTIKFAGMTSVHVNDNVANTTDVLTVRGTNGNDMITAAHLGTNNIVWVNAQAVVFFSGFNQLTLDGRFGNDSTTVSPVGMTFVGTAPQINVSDVKLGASTLQVNGTAAIGYNPTGPVAGNVTTAGPTVFFTNITAVTVDGDAGNDTLTYNSPVGGGNLQYTPGASPDAGTINGHAFAGFQFTPLSFNNLGVGGAVTFDNAAKASVDTLDLFGTLATLDDFVANGGADQLQILKGDDPTIFRTVVINTPSIDDVVLHGLGSGDTFNLSGPLPYTGTFVDSGDPAVVDLTGAAAAVTVNLGDTAAAPPTNTTITGYGGTVTLSGVDVANLDAGGNTLTAVGTAHADSLTYTPTGPTAGTFSNAGLNTAFNFTGVAGTFTMTGGTGGTDQLTIDGSATRDLFDIDQAARTVQVLAHNTVAWQTVTIDPTISTLTALGQSGQDTFQVIPGAGVGTFPLDNLLINIDGDSGATGANNALVISNGFVTAGTPAALPATSFVVDNRGQDLNSGTIRVFQSAVANPDINYTNVQVVSPLVATSGTPNGNLMIMGPDKNEPNDTQATATSLGSAGNIEVSNATVFASSFEFPGVPADQDYYSVTAQQTGTLDFLATFNLYNPALLPGGGQLNMQVLDAAGNVIASAAGGAASFGAEGTTANDRIRIPVVAGQTYFVHLFGANVNGTANGAVVNGYNLSIVDTPAIVPFNLELSRSVPAGVAGSPDTGDLPPGAPGDDTGRSQFDNVTKDNTPRIYLRLSDGIFLNDLPGNGTTDAPPVGVIPIPFSPNATTPGFRVAIFDGNNTQTPVGFASQVAGFPGLYEYDFTTPLADGIHNLTAEVQMVDPAKATETGFGGTSATFSLTIDTVPPPVSFGSTGVANSGLDGSSDSGVPGQPATIVDRITKVSTPTLYGVAEANSIVRLYDDLNGDGIVDAGDVFLGQATAIPNDGTNALPNGQWRITSNVDLNNPNLGFPLDGLRNLLVTGEDLAGNVSAPQKLSIFVDTQGPTVNSIGITGTPGFPLFNTKLTPTPVASPTPLISSLDITFNDLPVRVGPSFVYPAVNPILATTTSNYALVGENNGIIPITSVTLVDNTTSGTPGMTTVTLHFAAKDTPLPDDRYTLTVSDAITDNAGNALQGNFNGTSFPSGLASGNGSQGQTFVGSFTVNSRAHIGNYSSGTVALDINGNGVFDPQNPDANNRDAVVVMGYPTDRLFSGNFSTSYGGTPVPGTANGFQKLAAYGQDTSGNFRWLYDLSGTGGATTSVAEPFAIDGLPVAGNFAGSPLVAGSNPPVTTLGDQVGLFDGKAWYLDVLDQGYISAADLAAPATAAHPAGKLVSDMAGLPFVGNFDGFTDLGTYQNGVLEFDLASLDPAHILTGQWNVKVNVTNLFSSIPFNYVTARPLAGELNGLGQESSLGFYVPGGTNNNPGTADWYFLEPTSSTLTGAPPIPAAGLFASGTVSTATAAQQAMLQASGSYFFNLMHAFKDQPLGGNDLFYQFGDQFALPLLGIWDPPGDIGGLTSGSTPLSTTVAGTFVSNLYTQVLGRQASATDVAASVNQLLSGETPAQLAQSFVTSNEYHADQINQLYERYLGRPADATAVAYLTGVWNQTGGPELVQADIISSLEFFDLAQKQYPGLSGDAAWVTALYQNVLNRAAGTADLNYWVNYLQTNSRASVVLNFLTSTEYRLDLINSDFHTYLGRAVDPASAQAILQELQNGLTQDQLLTFIVSSDEYLSKP